jgi:hypothetical protein
MRRARGTALALVFIVAGAGAGCALSHTAPAKTYVLDPQPSSAVSSAAPASPVSVIGVLKVTVPGWIDRAQITGRTTTGEVASDEYARWGEPVGRGIQRVLAENLAVLLPDRRIVTAPFAPGDDPSRRVEVIVAEAARQADGTVLLESRWWVLGRHGATLAQGRSRQRTRPPDAGAMGTVAGLNETLAGLSREICDALKGLPAEEPTP